MMILIITGGAGYIGSHTCVLLIEAGYNIVIFDNFCNSSKESISRVEAIVERKIPFIEGDIREKSDLEKVFDTYEIDVVIHFAGLKAVGESVEEPLKYYDNNLIGTIILSEVMRDNGCKSIIFSSSATVYGAPSSNPITENFSLSATNPYARTKLFIEEILRDISVSDKQWRIVILRYFNPVGAHASGTIGDIPNGIPNNLMPFVAQTAIGKREKLSIFGDDYDTPDGIGVRDYIHVVDLAEGHLKALDRIESFREVMTINLGTGIGYSVLDMVRAFEKASQREVSYLIAPRRAGDIATCYADASYAKEVLGWVARRDIDDMCQDGWRWELYNAKQTNE